jgi:hypothetical protein
LPYVLRLEHLALGSMIEARPRSADWFGRIQALGSYPAMITSLLPQPILDMFRRNAEEVRGELEALIQAA